MTSSRMAGDERSTGDKHWRLRAGSALQQRRWGEQLVVFDPFSGNTHLLDRVAMVGFDCLANEPAGQEELCQRMAERLEIEADLPLQRYTGELIALLNRLGLIEVATP